MNFGDTPKQEWARWGIPRGARLSEDLLPSTTVREAPPSPHPSSCAARKHENSRRIWQDKVGCSRGERPRAR
eukprot:533312-Pyramimonas_sp.AAC.1